ncbi:DDE transposase [Paenibacillus silviterrae]|uniref:DDE transposase n=1 Tax=Paenibacillus silviterrae TaxID=3242194 RepID=UPI0025431184|nr:DDE transposase [Paenibacillus chinjuensis]
MLRTRLVTNFLECRLCRHQASLLTGSVFEGSKTDLTKWFTALALVSSDMGTSALRLSQIICVTYKTAWTMLQKIRYAIGSADMENLLLGIVQVNAAVYNRPLNASFQASPTEHPFFVGTGSSATAPDGTDYVKMKLISKKHIQNRIVHRDAIKAFTQNEISSAATAVTCVTQRYSSARLVPLLQLAGRASRWMNRTFKGLGRKHLQVYLDEFCYRINHSKDGASVLSSLTHLCMNMPRYTYRQLISFCS